MALDRNKIDRNKNNISKRLEDEDDIKQVAKTTKEELMYYLSPVYSKDQIKDLDEDQLMELLDEVIDRVYKVNMKRGGIIKDPSSISITQEDRSNLLNSWSYKTYSTQCLRKNVKIFSSCLINY